MQKIIVDDNWLLAISLSDNENDLRFTETSNSKQEHTEKTIKINSDIGELAEDISKRITISDTIIYINVNIKIGNHNRQESKGIEILKWLRLKRINNHCILYSFLSSTSIIKENSTNSILLSKGVTFLQAPFSHSDIKTANLEELADRANLLPFFRGEVDLIKIRHEMANIWGLERLKFLLKFKEKELYKNYSIELLKYITTIHEKRGNTDSSELGNQIGKFQQNNPVILYYDDMADQWGPVLKKILGTNFDFYTPAQKNEVEILTLIKTKKPKCFLLDLRLKNEKEFINNPLKYSGGKLLTKIKEQNFSLPVIMFTATNKAESVRKLLSAGAEYVWTKEGVDDGINDLYSMNNTLELLDRIKTCVLKFENIIYEKIFEVESKINSIYGSKNKIKKILRYGVLRDVDTILIDSNYLINSIKDGSVLLFNTILIANRELPANKKEVIIHEDVYNEIFTISKQNEYTEKNKERVPVARLLITLLYRWKKENLVNIPFMDGQQDAIDEVLNLNLDEKLSPMEKIQLEENTFFEHNAQKLQDDLYQQIENLNKQIELFNKGIEGLPDFNKIRLHADDVFKEIIPKYLRRGNVLFVTDDHTCSYYVGQLFDNGSNIKKRYYKCKFDLNNKDSVTSMEGIRSAVIGGYKYDHFFSREFIGAFTNTP